MKITYVSRRINPSYLASVTNSHSKTVVAYNVPQSLSEEASLKALDIAIYYRKASYPLIPHSDKGLK